MQSASNSGNFKEGSGMDDMLSYTEPVETLVPKAIFGINGKIKFGMHMSPDMRKFIFPIGNKITISDMKTNTQQIINGHSNDISCIDLSRSGKFIASGHVNHRGFGAFVKLWDFTTHKEIGKHDLHKMCVKSVCFTAEDKYVISIGGEDDGTVIVFDIETLTPICRSLAARNISGIPIHVTSLNNNSSHFFVVGDRHMRLWRILRDQKKLIVHDVDLGRHQRIFTSVNIDKKDEFAYMGTMTGDVIKVVLNCCDPINITRPGYNSVLIGSYGVYLPKRRRGKDCVRYVNGVRVVTIVRDGMLLIGSGDGTVDLVQQRKDVKDRDFNNYPDPTWPMLLSLRKCRLNGPISSMVAINANEYYICTEKNDIYKLNINTFALKLLRTCNVNAIDCVVFPKNLSSVFATAGYETIRIWSMGRLQELLRILVHNFQCAAMLFTADGSSIVSVWNDGAIRAFTPISGCLIYVIPNAHNKGCSALTICSNGRTLFTGGKEGQLRVWKIETHRQSLIAVLKGHTSSITSLDINHRGDEVISAGIDGSCVIWDVNRLTRKKVITANTQFMCARFFPSDVQFLACGADGVISYWMVYNGSLIRELAGSRKYSVNGIAITKCGSYFITVGNDRAVKIWDYNKGVVVSAGNYHGSAVSSVAISPNGKYFVSGSTDGSVIIWNMPEKYCNEKATLDIEMAQLSVDTIQKPSNNSPKHTISNTKNIENIKDILSKTSKDEVCCVECPDINKMKKPDINEYCNMKTELRNC